MRAFRRYVGRSVTVQVDGDESIRGAVSEVSAEAFTLTSASIITDENTVRADGVIVVPFGRIRWVQVL